MLSSWSRRKIMCGGLCEMNVILFTIRWIFSNLDQSEEIWLSCIQSLCLFLSAFRFIWWLLYFFKMTRLCPFLYTGYQASSCKASKGMHVFGFGLICCVWFLSTFFLIVAFSFLKGKKSVLKLRILSLL